MTTKSQHTASHLFGVDYIYGTHGNRFPTCELIELILITNITHTHQNVPNQPAITNQPAKVNSIDNQPLTPQNKVNTGDKPAIYRNKKNRKYALPLQCTISSIFLNPTFVIISNPHFYL